MIVSATSHHTTPHTIIMNISSSPLTNQKADTNKETVADYKLKVDKLERNLIGELGGPGTKKDNILPYKDVIKGYTIFQSYLPNQNMMAMRIEAKRLEMENKVGTIADKKPNINKNGRVNNKKKNKTKNKKDKGEIDDILSDLHFRMYIQKRMKTFEDAAYAMYNMNNGVFIQHIQDYKDNKEVPDPKPNSKEVTQKRLEIIENLHKALSNSYKPTKD